MLARQNLPKTADTKFQTAVYPSNLAWIGAKLCQNAFQTIPNVSFFDAGIFFSANFLDRKFRFSSIWRGFRESTAERTSKSDSSSNFALDGLIQRSVRPKNLGFGIFAVRAIFFHLMPARIPNTFSVRDLFPQPQIFSVFLRFLFRYFFEFFFKFQISIGQGWGGTAWWTAGSEVLQPWPIEI